MAANLENSTVATGLEKFSFHSNPKERQCQRMLKPPHNCTHLDMEQQTVSKLGKEYTKAVYCHSAYLTYMQVHHGKCQVGWSTAEIKIAGRNINNFRYADDTTLMAESKEELKSFLMKLKEESEKAGLKLNIQKTKIMASSHITSWQIDGETVETVTDYFLGLQNHSR